jgi:putative oxidoreductase
VARFDLDRGPHRRGPAGRPRLPRGILVAHAWQRFQEWTLAGTASSFEDMGIPAATASAYFVTGVEIFAGPALVIGLLTPTAAGLNMVGLLGALALVHAPNGVFVANNGFGLVLALFAGLITVAILGAGKFSTDYALARSAKLAG